MLSLRGRRAPGTHFTGTLRYLLDTVGSSQVMIGSDYPFMFRDQTPEEEFDALGLTPKEREALGSGNCLRFLRLT